MKPPTQASTQHVLAAEAQQQTWILAQWVAAAGPKASTPDPITRIRLDPEPPPAYLTEGAHQ